MVFKGAENQRWLGWFKLVFRRAENQNVAGWLANDFHSPHSAARCCSHAERPSPWFCLEVAEVNPIRKWTGSCDDFEDGLIEAFVLTCSCRFVTWGSINQARMHVVEFLRWTTGVVPPELPKTMYTMQKLKKLMAVERPEGRKLRTGFTVSEITAMFDVAWAAVDKENDGVQKAQLANMTAALGFIYERGLQIAFPL